MQESNGERRRRIRHAGRLARQLHGPDKHDAGHLQADRKSKGEREPHDCHKPESHLPADSQRIPQTGP